MSVLSLIVARAGSKGVLNKNIRYVRDKRIFEYSVQYSQNLCDIVSNLDTVVSSDSKIIEKYCEKNDIRFLKRNTHLSNNKARIEDVVYDVYKELESNYDYISIVTADTPIRYPSEFLRAYEFLEMKKNYDCAISMQKVGRYNPDWMFDIDENRLHNKEEYSYQKQGLSSKMKHDGHTLLFKSKYFLEYMKHIHDFKYLYESYGKIIKPLINNKLVIEIDTEQDYEIAKALLLRRYI